MPQTSPNLPWLPTLLRLYFSSFPSSNCIFWHCIHCISWHLKQMREMTMSGGAETQTATNLPLLPKYYSHRQIILLISHLFQSYFPRERHQPAPPLLIIKLYFSYFHSISILVLKRFWKFENFAPKCGPTLFSTDFCPHWDSPTRIEASMNCRLWQALSISSVVFVLSIRICVRPNGEKSWKKRWMWLQNG